MKNKYENFIWTVIRKWQGATDVQLPKRGKQSCEEETDAAKSRKNEDNENSNGTKATNCNDNEKQEHDAAVRRGGSGPSASIYAAGSNPDFIFPHSASTNLRCTREKQIMRYN